MEAKEQRPQYHLFAFVPRIKGLRGPLAMHNENTCRDIALYGSYRNMEDAFANKTTQEYCYHAEGIHFVVRTNQLVTTCSFEQLLERYSP